jgi:hypothetical protein
MNGRCPATGRDEEAVALNKPNGGIAYRFHARDVHLVMGPAARARRCDFAC